MAMKEKLSHLNARGEASMVDVSPKPITLRRAVAAGRIQLTRSIVKAIQNDGVSKGNVLEVARIAAIQAAKRTSELIPLCHPLPISKISVNFRWNNTSLLIQAEVKAEAKTGVEMEALTAVSVAGLVIYD